MIKIPPYLQKGDTIGLVCPAGLMPVEKVSECIRVLNEDWGLRQKLVPRSGSSITIFQALMKKDWKTSSTCLMMKM